MAKQINFNFEGVDYTLEFTRKSVEALERQGFVISDISEKPMTILPALFGGAFLAKHRFVKKDVTDAIFAKMTNKQVLLEKLSEMYSDPIIALMDEPEKDEGNVEWGASW